MAVITIKDFENDCSNYIWVREDGTLVIDSIFQREFMGNISLLLDCCADNIRETPEGYEIDYYQAIQDYYKSSEITNTERKMK